MSTSMDKSCICNMGTVDGCGYDGQQKYTICDACRQYRSILSILKPVFRRIQQIHCVYNSLRYLDRQIWLLLCSRRQTLTDYFTRAQVRRIYNNIMVYRYLRAQLLSLLWLVRACTLEVTKCNDSIITCKLWISHCVCTTILLATHNVISYNSVIHRVSTKKSLVSAVCILTALWGNIWDNT